MICTRINENIIKVFPVNWISSGRWTCTTNSTSGWRRLKYKSGGFFVEDTKISSRKVVKEGDDYSHSCIFTEYYPISFDNHYAEKSQKR